LLSPPPTKPTTPEATEGVYDNGDDADEEENSVLLPPLTEARGDSDGNDVGAAEDDLIAGNDESLD